MLAALGGVDLGRRQLLAECAAAEKGEIASFLILKRHDVDSERRRGTAFPCGARNLERVGDPQCPIEPAALRNGVGVRTDQERPGRGGIAAIDIGHFVHVRIEAGLAHALHEPAPGSEVVGRQSHAIDTSLELADGRELAQLGEKALTVDGNHD